MMNNQEYKGMSDEELILRFREGDEAVMGYLMNKYKNMVRGKANALFLIGGEREDLIQEGMIGLFQAVQNYDYGRDASFFTFAELCVTRKIYNAVKSNNSKKHLPLNTYISTYSNMVDGEGGNVQEGIALENMPAEESSNPESRALNQEMVEYMEKAIAEQLSESEREAFELYITGASSGEVARILGKNPKNIDNAIQRAKNKLKVLFEKNNFCC